jgi:hypothetical protein
MPARGCGGIGLLSGGAGAAASVRGFLTAPRCVARRPTTRIAGNAGFVASICGDDDEVCAAAGVVFAMTHAASKAQKQSADSLRARPPPRKLTRTTSRPTGD